MGGECGTRGREEAAVQGFGGKTKGKNHSEDRGVDGRTGLERIVGRFAWGCWSGFFWLRMGIYGGPTWS
jgi:hypothetical protein